MLHVRRNFPRHCQSLVSRSRLLWSRPPIHDSSSSKEWMDAYVTMSQEQRDIAIRNELKNCADIGVDSFSTFETLLNTTRGGAPFAIALRGDVLRWRRSGKAEANVVSVLNALDTALKRWLSAFMADDALTLETVTFSKSSGSMLEFIAKNEGVHSVKTLAELKNRLSYGKRCFALFHSNYKSDALAFIHVAFTSSISKSMSELEDSSFEGNAHLPSEGMRALLTRPEGQKTRMPHHQPTCAMFYSVNSPQDSLSGLDLAGRVIKRVTQEVNSQFPSVNTFCTLSPVPGFLNFLRGALDHEIEDTIFAEFPERYAELISSHLDGIEITVCDSLTGRRAALGKLVAFLDHIASSPLAHLAIATESTDDVISISNIHHKRNADIGADKPSLSFQSELVDMYQKEQTKILRFAHLAEDTLSYDSRLKEVQIVPTESSDAIDAEDTKQLSNVSAVKLREAWQALKKPLLWLCHHYLLRAKAGKKNEPKDPVARFHLRNGASLHQVNWGACVEDPKLMVQSAGIMVNYLYDLELQASRKELFKQNNSGIFHVHTDILNKYS